MDDYGRAHLLAEMDQVVLRVGQSTAHIAAQEERITASKEEATIPRTRRNSSESCEIACDSMKCITPIFWCSSISCFS